MFPLKASGEPTLSYNDAVEEALCFGWIDSTIKYIDPMHRAQRFTPRKACSGYSRPNIERLLWLDGQALLHPAVRESVVDIIYAPYVFPRTFSLRSSMTKKRGRITTILQKAIGAFALPI